MRNRMYDPVTGRFVSGDPIGLAGGDANLYGYALANPVDYIDPYGTSPAHAAVGAGACAIGGAINVGIGELLGHKRTFGDYARGAAYGCVSGALFVVGVGVGMKAGSKFRNCAETSG